MQKIIRIARLELSVLFYSPIAWIIMVIIFLQGGLNYTDGLYFQETQQQLERPLTVVTRVLFAGDKGMLSALLEYLYLYIPLLTMSIFSREYTSGSIKLLQSSPVTTAQVVLGKYLSIVVYAAIVVGLLGLYAVSAYYSVEHMDFKFVAFGLLGLFLLICTYSAIGLFMSSLTSYQIVAAISTLALLAFLNYAKVLGANYDGIREIADWLSIGGRAEEIVNGLFTSRELIYFLLIISFFLGITILRLVQERAGTGLPMKSLQYLSLFIVLLTIGYVSSLPSFIYYYDTTQIKDRTLSPKGQEIAARITEPIEMVSFVNVLDQKAAYGAPANRMNDISRFESYNRFIPHLKMTYIAYYDSISYLRLDSNETLASKAQKSAEALAFNFKKLLTPEQMKKDYPEVSGEMNSFVRYIHYNGNKEPLRMFDDMIQYPSEGEISAALLRLLDGPAKVGLLAGHGERNVESYMDADYSIYLQGKSVRGSIMNQGFEVNKISVDALDNFIGAGLIIADPKEPYSPEELVKIFKYIDNGNNVFIMADPSSSKYLNPIVEYLGLKYMEGTLMQESEDFDADLLKVYFTPEAHEDGFKYYDGAVVVMKNTVGIERLANVNKFKSTIILATDKSNTWNRLTPFDLATEKIKYNPTRDKLIEVPTAIKLQRSIAGKTQKIMVTGDADFMSNAEVTRFNINTVNTLFSTRVFKWFSDGKYPVSSPKDKAPDVKINVNRANINNQKLIFLLIIPAFIAFAATYVLRRRKNK